MTKKITEGLLLLLVIIIAGCSTNSPPDMIIKDAIIDIIYYDLEGNNMLNPNHPQAITEQNTNLYFVEDGEEEKVYEEHLDHPKQFFITDESPDGNHYLRLFPNIISGRSQSVTLIEFADSTKDTIKIEYHSDEEGNTSLRKIWYNHELKEEGENQKMEIICRID